MVMSVLLVISQRTRSGRSHASRPARRTVSRTPLSCFSCTKFARNAGTARLAFAVTAHALSFSITSTCGLVALVRQVPSGDGVKGRARSLMNNNEMPTPEEATQ